MKQVQDQSKDFIVSFLSITSLQSLQQIILNLFQFARILSKIQYWRAGQYILRPNIDTPKAKTSLFIES